jgi:hypothetical protein
MVQDLPKGVKPDKGLFKRAADFDKLEYYTTVRQLLKKLIMIQAS